MTHDIPFTQAWFAGGERVGYDPQARAIVPAQGGSPCRVVAKQTKCRLMSRWFSLMLCAPIGFVIGTLCWNCSLRHTA
jgi:hypothetical protein